MSRLICIGLFASLAAFMLLSCGEDVLAKEAVGKSKNEIIAYCRSKSYIPTHILVDYTYRHLDANTDWTKVPTLAGAKKWTIELDPGGILRKSKLLILYFDDSGYCTKAEIVKVFAI